MVIMQWGSLKFGVDGTTATLFDKMKISAECETEDKEASAQQYASAKAGKPVQVTFTMRLSTMLGVDVQSTAIDVLNSAQRSGCDYLYQAGKKLFAFKLMMTKADVSEIITTPSGKWAECQVDVTMRQATSDWMTNFSTASTSTATDLASAVSSRNLYAIRSAVSRSTSTVNAKNAISKAATQIAGGVTGLLKNMMNKVTAAKTKTSTVTTNTGGNTVRGVSQKWITKTRL